jgi:1,4-alpha-glucan branching enzyme
MTAATGSFFAVRPRYGVYGPIQCPNGWPSSAGTSSPDGLRMDRGGRYPAESILTAIHRDNGFDLPLDYIRPFIHEETFAFIPDLSTMRDGKDGPEKAI